MKLKKNLINFSLVIVSFILMLILIEVFLMIFFPQNLKIVQPDEFMMYKPIPDIERQYTRQEFSNTIKINEKGIRDSNYDYDKKDAYRILVLGDSFIMGNFVKLNNTFTKLLEKKINQISNRKVEIISGSTIGWGTNSELMYLKTEGYKYNPDLVILAFFQNDYGNNIMKSLFKVENNELKDNTPVKISKLKKIFYQCASLTHFCSLSEEFIISNINLVKLASKSKISNYKETKFKDKNLFSKNPESITIKAVNKTMLLIDEIKRFSPNLFLISIPYKYQIDENLKKEFIIKNNLTDYDMELPQKYLNRYLEQKNIPYIDLLPEYEKLNNNNDFFWKIDGHWNQKGIDLAVDLTYYELLNIVPEFKN